MQIPRLHPDTVEQVKQKADIYDVISEHVVLRKGGKGFVGLCPFHTEKTPSFSVSQSKQMYYCFGCNAGGDAIKFLMELQKQSFSEVVLDLARRYQVTVQTLEPEQRQQLQQQLSLREQLYEILAIASRFYQHALSQPQGQEALNYLLSKRQLNTETIQQFGLGYAPASWETLYRYLVEQKRYPVQLLQQAGLVRQRQSNDGYYDYFRNRLTIPILDLQGRVIGFGGRSLADEQPKYLNSPETELFSKGKTLFALDKAKSAISELDCGVVVEGYFDAISLHAAGITNVVASLGTALSLEQVRQLLRYSESKQLILNFDADAAGIQASERAIGEIASLAYRGEVQLKILNLPAGKDADEYLHTSTPEEYRELLAKAPLWLDWQIQQLIGDRDLKQATAFQQVAQGMVKLLQQIDNSDTRNYYISRCAEILSLGDARLVPLRAENLLAQISPKYQSSKPISYKTQKQSNPKDKAFPEASERSLLEQAEALLLRIYLHCPDHRQAVSSALQEQNLQFSLSHHRFLWQQIADEKSTIHPTDEQESLVSRIQTRCLESAVEIAQVSPLFHLDEKTQQDLLRGTQVIQAATACMERVLCEKRYRLFLDLWEQTDPVNEPEKSQFYYQSLYTEQRRLQKLDLMRQFCLTELS
jgi:DNA primase